MNILFQFISEVQSLFQYVKHWQTKISKHIPFVTFHDVHTNETLDHLEYEDDVHIKNNN